MHARNGPALVNQSTTADLAIVGGGPAGLAVAIRARLRGLGASVFDTGHPPIDRPCGEGLMPDALTSLEAMGVELDPDRSAPFAGIRYVSGSTVAEGRFPGRPGRGIRRTELHRSLVQRARELGVQLHWGERVVGLNPVGLDLESGAVQADWIVGADGRDSRVRSWSGLDARPPSRPRHGMRQHFEVEPWTDLVEVHWGRSCEAYVTPVGPRTVGLAFLWSSRKASFRELLDEFPSLARRLAGAKATSKLQGVGVLEARVRKVCDARTALVGDAGGFIDAIAGEGLALAFHQAEALIAAIQQGDLDGYQRAHERLLQRPRNMTRLLLLLDRWPGLRSRAIASLARSPAHFEDLLALHSRQKDWRDLGAPFVLGFLKAWVSA